MINLKHYLFGAPKSPKNPKLYQHLYLGAFLAWIGLGSDALSSACYGPEEAYRALIAHPYLTVFVTLATVITIFVLSMSYVEIIKLFPNGGGGYSMASRLIGPKVGMVSGCALLIDYVLTIAISVSAGAAALWSMLPEPWHNWKIPFILVGVVVLMTLNLRGIKESITILAPIFIVFIIAHVILLGVVMAEHSGDFLNIIVRTRIDTHETVKEMGWLAFIGLLLKAFSMGAGTFTGIEAVSNGAQTLKEPRVKTAAITMFWMAISLSVIAGGLMISYSFYRLQPEEGKTMNAVLMEAATRNWPAWLSHGYIFVSLAASAALLFIAAQTGYIDGPRTLSNMAADRWFPAHFIALSSRLVTHYGILFMTISSVIIVLLTHAEVDHLVVLYSINVFVTFFLSQVGLSIHCWRNQRSRLWIPLLAGVITLGILISVVCFKFLEGGWMTILITTSLVILCLIIRKHYDGIWARMKKLDGVRDIMAKSEMSEKKLEINPDLPTAAVLVSGFNGLSCHVLLNIKRNFPHVYKNFVFINVRTITSHELGLGHSDRLEQEAEKEMVHFQQIMAARGTPCEYFVGIGTDPVAELVKLVDRVAEKYHLVTFFAGTITFGNPLLEKLLHNGTIDSVQSQIASRARPFVFIPTRI
jgi:amino acid transporter